MLAATLLLIAGVATAAPAESFSSAFGLEARQSAGLGSMFPESCKSQCTVLLDAYAGCHTGDMVTCATLCPADKWAEVESCIKCAVDAGAFDPSRGAAIGTSLKSVCTPVESSAEGGSTAEAPATTTAAESPESTTAEETVLAQETTIAEETATASEPAVPASSAAVDAGVGASSATTASATPSASASTSGSVKPTSSASSSGSVKPSESVASSSAAPKPSAPANGAMAPSASIASIFAAVLAISAIF